jgi:hypothetical protein
MGAYLESTVDHFETIMRRLSSPKMAVYELRSPTAINLCKLRV